MADFCVSVPPRDGAACHPLRCWVPINFRVHVEAAVQSQDKQVPLPSRDLHWRTVRDNLLLGIQEYGPMLTKRTTTKKWDFEHEKKFENENENEIGS